MPAVTVTVADEAPPVMTVAEVTGRFGLSLASRTTVQPAGAAVVRVTLHVLTDPELRAEGLHDKVDGARTVVNVSATACETPFIDAVIDPEPSAVMPPAVAVKVAKTEPAAIVTDDGIVRRALLSERVTALPPVGAGLDRTTVHVVAAPVPRIVGEQESEVREVAAARRLRVAVWEAPPSEAVTVAGWSEGIVPAVTVKVPAVAPAAMVTEAGVVSAALLSETVTAVPPVGATLERVAVQVLVPLEFRLVGVQARKERVTAVTRLMEAVRETPLRVAVTVAL